LFSILFLTTKPYRVFFDPVLIKANEYVDNSRIIYRGQNDDDEIDEGKEEGGEHNTMQMTILMKTAIVWGAVISLSAIIASAPSLSDRFMNNVTTDTLTLLYVCGIVFMVAIVAYLVSNYSAVITKCLAIKEPRQ
jgi:hypothetical protein